MNVIRDFPSVVLVNLSFFFSCLFHFIAVCTHITHNNKEMWLFFVIHFHLLWQPMLTMCIYVPRKIIILKRMWKKTVIYSQKIRQINETWLRYNLFKCVTTLCIPYVFIQYESWSCEECVGFGIAGIYHEGNRVLSFSIEYTDYVAHIANDCIYRLHKSLKISQLSTKIAIYATEW